MGSTHAKLSAIERFHDKLAYRDEVLAVRRDMMTMEGKDRSGAAYYDLKFSEVMVPPEDDQHFYVVKMTVITDSVVMDEEKSGLFAEELAAYIRGEYTIRVNNGLQGFPVTGESALSCAGGDPDFSALFKPFSSQLEIKSVSNTEIGWGLTGATEASGVFADSVLKTTANRLKAKYGSSFANILDVKGFDSKLQSLSVCKKPNISTDTQNLVNSLPGEKQPMVIRVSPREYSRIFRMCRPGKTL